MDFKQIEAFVNVVKYKGFSKAAEATYLTQPTISAHINTLEKELGTHLIDRTGKGATPTPEGRQFYNYALTMLNTREQAVFSMKDFISNITGSVSIVTSSIPGEYMVPKLITRFNRKYENAGFQITQLDSAAVEEWVLGHRAEIGFSGQKEENGLTYSLLMQDSQVLITPKAEYYANAFGEGALLSDIVKEPLIIRESGSGTRKSLEKALSEEGISEKELNIIAVMNSIEAIKNAVSGGLGVSVIPKIAADTEIDDGRYMSFDLDDSFPKRDFYLVCNDRITMTPTAETFRYFVLDYFGISDSV